MAEVFPDAVAVIDQAWVDAGYETGGWREI
jgi:hypothetical protein